MDDETLGAILIGVALGTLYIIGVLLALPDLEPQIKYIYDDEARLVGFCDGKYLIRTEEDEFPAGCQFIEPITWKDGE